MKLRSNPALNVYLATFLAFGWLLAVDPSAALANEGVQDEAASVAYHSPRPAELTSTLNTAVDRAPFYNVTLDTASASQAISDYSSKVTDLSSEYTSLNSNY